MHEVILHLPDTTYERLAVAATAEHRPIEQLIVDIIMANTELLSPDAERQALLAAALDALGFERLDPEQTQRLSALLKMRQERQLSREETAELQTLMDTANALELTSLQRLAASLGR